MAARPRLRPALALIAVFLLVGCGGSAGNGPSMETTRIGNETFRLELAADAASTTRGLMERTSIPADGGMLFVFPEVSVRWFWMKDCVIDIDLIFLDGQGMVTAMHRMKAEAPQGPDESDFTYETRLERYSSRFPAQFAIELKAGSLDRIGVRVEDRIELDLARLKAMAR